MKINNINNIKEKVSPPLWLGSVLDLKKNAETASTELATGLLAEASLKPVAKFRAELATETGEGSIVEDGSEKLVAPVMTFEQVCEYVKGVFDTEWQSLDDFEKQERLELEKAAILGYEDAMQFYKERIAAICGAASLHTAAPPAWYESLVEGVFAELYGLAGLSPWVYDKTEAYKNSSSAKLIGDRLYCLIDGKPCLQPQRISEERRRQLKRAFLMTNPSERMEKGFHELYLTNGIRITIYSGSRTKPGQDIMVFRKYILKDLSLEHMADLGTIPRDAIPLFELMVKVGFNVIFAGPVRSGKTTFLQMWQRMESSDMEGLAISTDPETPWDKIMPGAPIMQLVADGNDLASISKSLLRGDNDYVILEEMRDAQSYRLALDLASIGHGRCKATVHTTDVASLPYKLASKIKSEYGGDEQSLISQVFASFDYVLEFAQDKDNRAQKILKSISEFCYDAERDKVSVHKICEYAGSGSWKWRTHLGKDKDERLRLWKEEKKMMVEEMKKLESKNPIMENAVIYPRYYRPSFRDGMPLEKGFMVAEDVFFDRGEAAND